MGGTSVRRPSGAPPHEREQTVLRASDPPDLVVRRRVGIHIDRDTSEQDRRRPRSRAVIADVHAVTRHGMRALLAMCEDVEVVGEASSVSETVSAVLESGADLVVVGFDPSDHVVIKKVRQEAPFTRILVLSPSIAEEEVARAIQAGASGYLSKSAEPEQFRAAVDTVRSGGTYLDGTATTMFRSGLQRTGGRRGRAEPQGDLTDREMEVARYVAEGLTARRIGSKLGISDRTVNTHIGSLYRRLGVNNRVDALRELIRRGITPAPR